MKEWKERDEELEKKMEEDRDILKGEMEKLKFPIQGQQRDSKVAKYQWKLQPCVCVSCDVDLSFCSDTLSWSSGFKLNILIMSVLQLMSVHFVFKPLCFHFFGWFSHIKFSSKNSVKVGSFTYCFTIHFHTRPYTIIQKCDVLKEVSCLQRLLHSFDQNTVKNVM